MTRNSGQRSSLKPTPRGNKSGTASGAPAKVYATVMERGAAEAAVAHVCASDKKLAGLISKIGPLALTPQEMHSPYESLVRSIIYQQLSGKAAASIHRKLLEVFDSSTCPTPEQILSASDELLRSAGVSGNKARALRSLAEKAHEGFVPDHDRLFEMTDDEIIERLTQIRGIGRWTVEMMLIFKMGRLDVLSSTDFGVRKGFALLYRKSAENLPTPRELHEFGERWRPYRTVGSWYMWRATEFFRN